jgi:hypothetical protein
MRRIKFMLAALAVVVAAFAGVSGPAIADDNWNNHNRWDDNWDKGNDWNNNWRWNDNHDNDNWGWNDNRWDDGWGWNNWGWNNWGEVQDCPFWGDFEGPINQGDCFD